MSYTLRVFIFVYIYICARNYCYCYYCCCIDTRGIPQRNNGGGVSSIKSFRAMVCAWTVYTLQNRPIKKPCLCYYTYYGARFKEIAVPCKTNFAGTHYSRLYKEIRTKDTLGLFWDGAVNFITVLNLKAVINHCTARHKDNIKWLSCIISQNTNDKILKLRFIILLVINVVFRC